jgi:hypothetical protein
VISSLTIKKKGEKIMKYKKYEYPEFIKKYPEKFIQALEKEFGSDLQIAAFIKKLRKGKTGDEFEEQVSKQLSFLSHCGINEESWKYTQKRKSKREELIEKWERLRDDIRIESRDEKYRFLRYFEYIARKYFSAKSSPKYSRLENQYYSNCLSNKDQEISRSFNAFNLKDKMKEIKRMRLELRYIFRIKTKEYDNFT